MNERGQDPIQNLLYPLQEGAIDQRGNVADEVACRACGYNLKALPAGGRCPECGTPIGVSASGDWLQNSRPDWVWHVARWTEAVAWADLLLLCGLGLMLYSPTRLAGVIGTALVLEFWAVAMWQAVSLEPSQQRSTGAQRVARIACVLAAGLVAIGVIFAAAGMLQRDALALVYLGTWAAFAAASACHLRVLSQLMYRAPSTELAWRLGLRARSVVFWHIAFALCVVAEVSGTATCCLGFASGIGALWVTIGMCVLAMRAAGMMKLEARIGVENWRYHQQVSAQARRER